MRFILGFAVLLVLLVVGLLVAPSFIDWDKYKAQGLAQVKAQTGYDVSIDGDFEIGFLPAPHVKAQKVKVVNPSVSNDPIASFEDLSVGVAIAPLLEKRVQVSDITLIKPVFDLRVDRAGKGNWLSSEVEAKIGKKDGAQGAAPTPAKSSGASQAISFDNVKIEDGTFRFFDAAKNKDTQLTDINVDISASSLKGPFDGKGSLKFGGQDVAFDIDADAIDGDALPINAQIQYGAYGVALKGVAGIAAPYDVQGATKIELSSASLPISKDVVIEGILSANAKKASIKDAKILFGASAFNGEADVVMKPLAVRAAFTGSDIIDLAEFLPKSSGTSSGGSSASKKGGNANDPLLMLTEIVPKSITLPQDFTADVALKTGGIRHDQVLLKDTSIKASKAGKNFKGSLNASDIPGTGPASIDADLVFGSTSQSKTGAQVFSGPTLNYTVQANTQNTGNLVKALTGKTNIPVVSEARIGKFYIKGNAKPGRFALGESVVNLDDLKVQMSGNVRQGDAKPVLDATVSSSIDDPYAFAKKLEIDSSKWPKNLGGVIIGADLKGTMDDLSADAKVNAFGADFIVSGKLDELMAGSSLDNLNVRVKHSNLSKLLSNVGASAPAYAAVSQPVDAKLTVQMDGKVVNLKNIDAALLGTNMRGALRYDGNAGKPSLSGDLTFGSLTLKSVGGSSKGSSGASGGSKSSGEKWSTAPMKNGWLHAANANVNIAAERLIYETWDVSKPSIKLNMNNGTLDISELKGGLFGGQLSMKSKVASQSVDSAVVSLSADASMNNVNIEKLAGALSNSKRLQGSGTVSLGLNVNGTGSSQKALVSSLAGQAKLSGNTIVIQGFDLEAVTNAVANDNRESILAGVQSLNSGSTNFETLNGDYSIANGVVTISSMAMEGKSASLTSKGNASLPAWTMDTQHTVSFNQTDKLDPFTFAIRGPINKPISTLGNIGGDILRAQAGKYVQEVIQDKLIGTDIGDKLQKFGILPGAKKQEPVSNDNPEPAAGGDNGAAEQPLQEAPSAPAQKTPEEQAQEAIEGVLKGLFE